VADVQIRRLRKEDAADIKKIDAAVTKGSSALDFERMTGEEVDRTVDASFVAEMDGKVVGYMISYFTSGSFGVDKCAWIAMFGVDPKIMGQGIGKRLAEEIFNLCKRRGITDVFTSVRWDSTDILSFFKTLGFERSDFINLRKIL
jgi:ribosomal protein S18 acetylase RimI-like enzyme